MSISKKMKFLLFTVMAIFMIALVGCGAEDDSTTEEPATDPTTEEPANEDVQESTYTVEHAMGTTEISGTPERVVILTNEGTEALLALGVTPVGAVQSWTPTGEFYDHIADQMKGVEIVGTESEPSLEAIAALEPDLIIGNKMRQEEVYEQLNAIAPTVFAESLRGNWKINFELYAKAVNKVDEGQEVLDNYATRIQEFAEKAGDKLNTEISIVRFTAGDIRIYQKDSFSGVILEEIGFARPEAQDVEEFAIRNVTKEMIPQMEGDILFYFTYETGDGKASDLEKEWLEDPLFQKLEVVQAGNIHKVSDETWNTAGGVIAANLMIDDLENYFLN